MLAAIVRSSLAHPRIVTALSVLIAVLGAAALLAARFDVFPDFAPPHVLVQTETPGLDATQVEALVTRPLEGLLAGTENVKTVRSTSSQGLSAIRVIFDRGGDPAGKIDPASDTPGALIDRVLGTIAGYIARFDDRAMPYRPVPVEIGRAHV